MASGGTQRLAAYCGGNEAWEPEPTGIARVEANVGHALTANVAAKCFRTTILPSSGFWGEKNDEAIIIAYLANDCKAILPDRWVMC